MNDHKIHADLELRFTNTLHTQELSNSERVLRGLLPLTPQLGTPIITFLQKGEEHSSTPQTKHHLHAGMEKAGTEKEHLRQTPALVNGSFVDVQWSELMTTHINAKTSPNFQTGLLENKPGI